MKQQPENFWNERYASEAYAYGILPNSFFKKQLDQLKPGKILLPAEGEGRNAVYAATQSWKALAFDISDSGRKKSLDLADKHQVNIEYLSEVITEKNGVLYPDSVFGTDSHTTMINALGVLGWGVGGIEAEAVMLGEPSSLPVPEVVGVSFCSAICSLVCSST